MHSFSAPSFPDLPAFFRNPRHFPIGYSRRRIQLILLFNAANKLITLASGNRISAFLSEPDNQRATLPIGSQTSDKARAK
jgi:hypothetical protein